jgi:hypothetical protein
MEVTVMARNKVIAGDYEWYNVKSGWGGFSFSPPLFSQHDNPIEINRNTVCGYEIMANDHRKSAVSGIMRGVIGNYFFGNAGMIGGAMSAKNKGDYIVAVSFYDGRRSMIEVDEKKYKELMRSVF